MRCRLLPHPRTSPLPLSFSTTSPSPLTFINTPPMQIGTPTASVSAQIADVQRLLQKSGLSYSMHSAGTTVGA